MSLLNLHTHRPPTHPGEALINRFPESFAPHPGEYYSIGIHPWHIPSLRTPAQLCEPLAGLLRHPQVLAVGEAGLDKLSTVQAKVQEEVFILQAHLAEESRKPLIIHLVKALDDLLRIHRQLRPSVPWIIHGFRGKPQQAETLLAHGFCLSFGEHFNEHALRLVPSDRLFLETDESPLTIEEILRHAATVREVPEEELRTTVQANLTRICGLTDKQIQPVYRNF